jgi:NSS family neurotransmitter:Na+ symporter
MAATGAAVGLGNIWKFPYMAGKNGGSAFVLLYLLCILFIGLPLMTAEIVLGRLGRKNPIDSLKKLAKEHQASTAWSLTGWIGALALLLVLAFYSVISGWVLAYFFKIISGEQNHFSAHSIQQEWSLFLKTPVYIDDPWGCGFRGYSRDRTGF